MLDFDWMINTLKEAIEEEEWELVREVIAYLKKDDVLKITDKKKIGLKVQKIIKIWGCIGNRQVLFDN